jgi:hypothetical protein
MEQPEWPIFVFLDDTSLDVCESLDDARRDYEGIDIERGAYSFFDFAGYPLKPFFTVPNRHSKFLGLIRSCSSGVFTFERDPSLNIHVIANALSNAEYLNQNQRFGTLADVWKHLECRGCSIAHHQSKPEQNPAEQASSSNGG